MKRIFLFESREHIKPRVYSLLAILLLVLAAGGYVLYSFYSGASFSVTDLLPSIDSLTPITLFYSGVFSGLFFVPIPLEFAFIAAIRSGSPAVISIVSVVAGFVLGNVISYLVGWKLSRVVMHLVSAKKMYGLRRKVNEYGGYVVLLFNLIPAPSPQLTFGLAMARYNMARLFSLLIIGNVLKFCVIAMFV